MFFLFQDYGVWERGDKTNHGLPELNSSSIGMAKVCFIEVRDSGLPVQHANHYTTSNPHHSHIEILFYTDARCYLTTDFLKLCYSR